MSSTRADAERIVNTRATMDGDAYAADLKLVDMIDKALQARDERAAKIARDRWMEMSALGSVESDHYARAGHEIAAAIIGEKCPHGIYRELVKCGICEHAIRKADETK